MSSLRVQTDSINSENRIPRWFKKWPNFIPDRWRSRFHPLKGSRELTIPKRSLWITRNGILTMAWFQFFFLWMIFWANKNSKKVTAWITRSKCFSTPPHTAEMKRLYLFKHPLLFRGVGNPYVIRGWRKSDNPFFHIELRLSKFS